MGLWTPNSGAPLSFPLASPKKRGLKNRQTHWSKQWTVAQDQEERAGNLHGLTLAPRVHIRHDELLAKLCRMGGRDLEHLMAILRAP